MLLLLSYTGDPKRIAYWAEITAPLIANGRCIVYVDFVEDVAPLSMRLREEHDAKAGSFYGRGLSGHDKDKVLKSWSSVTLFYGMEPVQVNVSSSSLLLHIHTLSGSVSH